MLPGSQKGQEPLKQQVMRPAKRELALRQKLAVKWTHAAKLTLSLQESPLA
jgi:hypothetical protein